MRGGGAARRNRCRNLRVNKKPRSKNSKLFSQACTISFHNVLKRLIISFASFRDLPEALG